MLIWIEKKLKKESRILDIGCSNGAFLKALNNKGYKEVYGIDIQKEIIEFTTKKNLNCYFSKYPEEIPNQIKNLKFDLITSFENIYYMEDVVKFFKVSSELLNRRGKIMLKFNQSSSSYYIKHPYHIRVGDFNTFINTDTIKYISKIYNFKIIDILPFANNVIIDYLGYSSYKTKPREKPGFLLKVLNKALKLIIPVKYSDKIIVILEKYDV